MLDKLKAHYEANKAKYRVVGAVAVGLAYYGHKRNEIYRDTMGHIKGAVDEVKAADLAHIELKNSIERSNGDLYQAALRHAVNEGNNFAPYKRY